VANVMYVTTYDPTDQAWGGAAWVDSSILEGWRSESEVSVLTVCDPSDRNPIPLEIRSSKVAVLSTLCRMALAGEPYQAAKFRSSPGWKRKAELFRQRADELRSRGGVIVTSQWPALLLALDAKVVPDVHIAHNVDTVIARKFDPRVFRILGNGRRMAVLERRLLDLPTRILAISRTDTARIKAWGLGCTHLDLSPEAFAPAPHENRSIGFLGKSSWPPNHEAILRLVNDVMPRVRSTLATSDVTLTIAGRGSEVWAGNDGVVVLGPVQTVGEFYDVVDLVAVPRLGEATGISVKVMEAIEHGVPVIVPHSVADDAALRFGTIIADDVEATVNELIKFFSAPRTDLNETSIGDSSVKSVRKQTLYSWTRDSDRSIS
jgi:glycosyltransferase involved in cell wall biosynthesis